MGLVEEEGMVVGEGGDIDSWTMFLTCSHVRQLQRIFTENQEQSVSWKSIRCNER